MKPAIPYHDDLLRRLKNPQYAANYLNACLQDEEEGVFLLALRDVAQVHGGIRCLSSKSGLNREHLFKMLSKKGNPRLNNLRQLLDVFGFRLNLQVA